MSNTISSNSTISFQIPSANVDLKSVFDCPNLTISSDGSVKGSAALKSLPAGSVDLVIPSEIDGIPVTKIDMFAFDECTSLKSVIIPNSVTVIDMAAFIDCHSLKSVTIPNSVTTINMGAFSKCSALTFIDIPSSVTIIGEQVFDDCTSLTSVTISNRVTRIEQETFRDCKALTSIIIPEGITSIAHSAFTDCTSLTSVTIPNSITSIGVVFVRCNALSTININKPKDSIPGAPWGAPNANAIKWLG